MQKDNKLKITLIATSIIILLGISFLILKKGKKGNFNYAIFDQNKPIIIKKDGKYGYINTSGKVIVEPKYEDVRNFNGNYAIVYEMVKTDDGEKKLCKIIDKNGKVKITPQEDGYCSIEYISDYNIYIINNKLYDSNLRKLSSDDKYVEYNKAGYLSWFSEEKRTAGIMTTSGKIPYTFKYTGDYADKSYEFEFRVSDIDDSLNSRYCVSRPYYGYSAIVNCDSGKIVVESKEDYYLDDDDNIFSFYTDGKYDKKIYFYIQNNKIVYKDSNEIRYYSAGYLRINDNDNYKYYDIKTGSITDEIPSKLDSLSDLELMTGYSKFSCDNGYGLMQNGKVLLPCQWDRIDFFDTSLYQYLKSLGKNYIIVKKDSKSFIFDLKNNKTIYEINSSYVTSYTDSTFISYTDENRNRVIYNLLTGKSITITTDDSYNIYSNYIKVKHDKKYDYYNTNLKLIYTSE